MKRFIIYTVILLLINIYIFGDDGASQQYKIPIIKDNNNLYDQNFLKDSLDINVDREDLARRAEITFFSSFAYLWAYQLILFDILFAEQFNDTSQSGKLSSTNFVYSLLTSALMALMVARKDVEFIKLNNYREPNYGFSKNSNYYRENTHEWRFLINFMNYDF